MYTKVIFKSLDRVRFIQESSLNWLKYKFIDLLLMPLHNIGKTKQKKCSQIYTQLAWYEDNDGRKLSLKYLCLMCYCFRIITGSQIRSNNAECIVTVFS